MDYPMFQVDAFTREPFTGNPAGVVLDADGLTPARMQAIARELNNPETAFILSPSGPDHDVWVRFFTPTTEVPSCGHATIAAHHVRAHVLDLPTSTVVQKIGAGILPVDLIRTENGHQVVMTQGKPVLEAPIEAPISDEILRALGLGPEDRDDRCPIQVASTGHSKVMVGVRSTERLHAIRPDLPSLVDLSARIGCNGYFVFVLTPREDVLVHARMFAPAIGINEDPVTGNGNGPLGAYLVHHGLALPEGDRLSFRSRQGEAMGRPGTLEVTVDLESGRPSKVRVAGDAVIVFRSTIRA